jgi:hypothetical protein
MHLFSLYPAENRLYGRYNPKDASCTMSRYNQEVRRDGNFFAYLYGKIGVEPCVGRLSGSGDQCFRSVSGSLGKRKRVATGTAGGGA